MGSKVRLNSWILLYDIGDTPIQAEPLIRTVFQDCFLSNTYKVWKLSQFFEAFPVGQIKVYEKTDA